MTSSLVGSEMCIRDRFRNVPAGCWHGARSFHRVPHLLGFPLHPAITAVSYTHLTLPTICSV
eukprot:10010255-Prorocentrum_lima.AAC.1